MRYQKVIICMLCIILLPVAVYSDRLTQANKHYKAGEYEEAFMMYQELSTEGNPEAMYNLGVMYFDGVGVEQDYREGIKYFKKAADEGFVKAQFALGVKYFNGAGVPQNKQ